MFRLRPFFLASVIFSITIAVLVFAAAWLRLVPGLNVDPAQEIWRRPYPIIFDLVSQERPYGLMGSRSGTHQTEPTATDVFQASERETHSDENFQAAGANDNLSLQSDRSRSDKTMRGTSKSPGGFLNVRYDLGGRMMPEDALTIRKKVMAHGANQGEVTLRIDGDARILVRTGDIRILTGQMNIPNRAALRRSLSQSEFVDLDVIRRAGLGISYDPMNDSLLLDF